MERWQKPVVTLVAPRAGVVFLCRFPLESCMYSIHEISSMFGFDRK